LRINQPTDVEHFSDVAISGGYLSGTQAQSTVLDYRLVVVSLSDRPEAIFDYTDNVLFGVGREVDYLRLALGL